MKIIKCSNYSFSKEDKDSNPNPKLKNSPYKKRLLHVFLYTSDTETKKQRICFLSNEMDQWLHVTLQGPNYCTFKILVILFICYQVSRNKQHIKSSTDVADCSRGILDNCYLCLINYLHFFCCFAQSYFCG